MDNLLPITITIGDRSYRIRVEPHEEEMVRKTVKYLNDKIAEFRTTVAGKDMQDFIAMVLVWYATQPREDVDGAIKLKDVEAELERFERLLDRGLQPLEDNAPPAAG